MNAVAIAGKMLVKGNHKLTAPNPTEKSTMNHKQNSKTRISMFILKTEVS